VRGCRAFLGVSLVMGTAGLLSSCSGPRPIAATAEVVCRGAFGSKPLNWVATTVGAVRAFEPGGPDPAIGTSHPYSHAFANNDSNQMAGWCWTGKPTAYRLFAVAPNYAPLLVQGLSGKAVTTTPPPGPAPIG